MIMLWHILDLMYHSIFGCGCYVGSDAMAGNIVCDEHSRPAPPLGGEAGDKIRGNYPLTSSNPPATLKA